MKLLSRRPALARPSARGAARAGEGGSGERLGRWWLWALGLLLGLGLGLLAHAPARWLATGLSHATDGRLQLPNASGTVWSGRADVLLSAGPGSRDRTALEQGLWWRLRPSWQAGPALAWQIGLPCCSAQPLSGVLQLGRAGASVQGEPGGGLGPVLHLSAHRSELPVTLLAGLGAPWNSLGLHGRLQLHTDGLRLHRAAGGWQLHGSLRLQALDLASALSTLRPLGSYQLHIEALAPTQASAPPEPAAALQLSLSTLSGPLQLSGAGSLSGGRVQFRGIAQTEPQYLGALSNLLNIMGQRDGLRSHLRLG